MQVPVRSLSVTGGASAYRGAPALAARAAGRAGAGTVTVAAPDILTDSIAAICPEATHIPLAHDTESGLAAQRALSQLAEAFELRPPDALAIGPGLGRSPGAAAFVAGLLQDGPNDIPMALDADALTLMSAIDGWQDRLKGATVLSPHPGEMARLCDVSAAEIQTARVEIATARAREWDATIVLKGAYTVIASPDEPPSICPLALPALASGGAGDALTGIIAAFLAQGLPPHDAAQAAVYVHGAAAALAAQDNGNLTSGLLASDLIEKIPAAMDVIRRGGPPPAPLFV